MGAGTWGTSPDRPDPALGRHFPGADGALSRTHTFSDRPDPAAEPQKYVWTELVPTMQCEFKARIALELRAIAKSRNA